MLYPSFYIWVLVLYNNEFILCTVAKGALQNEVLLKVSISVCQLGHFSTATVIVPMILSDERLPFFLKLAG